MQSYSNCNTASVVFVHAFLFQACRLRIEADVLVVSKICKPASLQAPLHNNIPFQLPALQFLSISYRHTRIQWDAALPVHIFVSISNKTCLQRSAATCMPSSSYGKLYIVYHIGA